MRRHLSLVLVLTLVLTSVLPALAAGAEELTGTAGTVVLYSEDFNDANSGWNWDGSSIKSRTAVQETLAGGNGILKFGWTAESLVSPDTAIPFTEYMTRMVINWKPRFGFEYINGKSYNYYIDYLCNAGNGLDTSVSAISSHGFQGFSKNGKSLLVSYGADGAKNLSGYITWTSTGKTPDVSRKNEITADGWKRLTASNIAYALEYDGEPYPSISCRSWYVSYDYSKYLAKMLVDNKLYCGKGVSKILWSNVSNTNSAYQFTITEEDLDGTEKGIVEGGKTKADLCKTYSIADDCSDLYSEARVNKINEELKKYYIAFDKIGVTADAMIYEVPVTINGAAEVNAVANTYTNEVQTISKSGNISANDYFGLTFTVTPSEGNAVKTVEYAGETLSADESGTYSVAPEKVKNGGLVITTETGAVTSKITYSKTGNGSVKIGETTLAEGENDVENGEKTFTVTPSDGYEISSVTLGENDIPVQNKLGFDFAANITGDTTLSVVFVQRTNVKPTLTVSTQANVNNGNYNGHGAENSNAITMYATVDEGYGYNILSYGYYITNAENNTISLAAEQKTADGKFGILAFGAGLTPGNYTLKSFIKLDGGDEINGEEQQVTING